MEAAGESGKARRDMLSFTTGNGPERHDFRVSFFVL